MKKLTAYILSILLLLGNMICVFAYSDITAEYDWAADAITDFQKQGVIHGYPDGSFRPEHNVTRAELAKLIVTLFGAGNQKEYTDVSEQDWYYPYVSQSGSYFLTESAFSPEAYATREEVAYAVITAKQLTNGENGNIFYDASEIDSRYTQAVQAAVTYGVITGYPDNTFRPKNKITRAETAVLLKRSLTATIPEKTPGISPEPEATPSPTPSAKANNYFFLVSRVSKAVDENNDPITKITGYNEGVLEEIILKDVDVSSSIMVPNQTIQKNDIIAFTRDYFGDVRFAQIVLRPSGLPDYPHTQLLKIGNNNKRCIVAGVAQKRYGNHAVELLSTDGNETQLYSISKSANVYILKKSGKLELSDISEIIDSSYGETGDTLIGFCYDDELKEILIIKE